MEELIIARDELDHENELKHELNSLARKSGVRVTNLQWPPVGKH